MTLRLVLLLLLVYSCANYSYEERKKFREECKAQGGKTQIWSSPAGRTIRMKCWTTVR